MLRGRAFFKPRFINGFVTVGVFMSLAQVAQAQEQIVLSDYDGTLVSHRISQNGTHSTPYVLFKVTEKPPVFEVLESSGPIEIEVSAWDFERLTQRSGNLLTRRVGPGQIFWGALQSLTLQNGETIVPQHYEFDQPRSFRYFLNHLDPKPTVNRILESFKEAEAAPTPEGFKPKWEGHLAWQGTFFREMQLMLSNPETAANFGVITARYHPIEHWKALFRHWKKRGYIEYLPNFDLFLNVGDPKYDHLVRDPDPALRKAAVLDEFIRTLIHVPARSSAASESPSHRLIVAEDTQRNLEKMVALFKGYAMSPPRATVPVEFAVFNAGTPTEIRDSKIPEFTVIEPTGRLVRSVFDEFVRLPKSKSKRTRGGSVVSNCAAALGGLF